MSKIATTVYDVQEVTLQDDDETTVRLRPLSISNLRKFHAEMGKLDDLDPEDEFAIMNQLVKIALVCLTKEIEKTKLENQEWVEEALDMPTVYKVIEVCGGVKLNDPNLIAAATEALNQDQDGTN